VTGAGGGSHRRVLLEPAAGGGRGGGAAVALVAGHRGDRATVGLRPAHRHERRVAPAAAPDRRDRPFHRLAGADTGESGTGKELVAQLIHEIDTRPRKHDLVVLDCATVVPTLSPSARGSVIRPARDLSVPPDSSGNRSTIVRRSLSTGAVQMLAQGRLGRTCGPHELTAFRPTDGDAVCKWATC
jgi:Sigma-54 interaction domain